MNYRLRRLISFLTGAYVIFLVFLCFSPQWGLVDGIKTPNIIYWGRLRFLLVPFNSLVSLGDLPNWQSLLWVLGQNLANVFLLYPLVFGILLLFPKANSIRMSLLLGFSISLTIECMQLLLDQLIDANRVFEIDDLITNTVGSLLAYESLSWLRKNRMKTF